MNDLLRRTHKKEYINILKARDFYFDRSRQWSYVSLFLTIFPPVMLAISYLPFLPHYAIINDARDIIIGVLSIISFLIIHFLAKREIDDNLEISNALREKYDCLVLRIPENLFAYSIKDITPYLSKAEFIKDYYKYEVWYEEIFGDNDAKNAICAQLDNILYTYHVYREYKKYIYGGLIVILIVSLLSLNFGITVFVLVLLSLFNAVQYYIESLTTTNALIKRNSQIVQIVRANKEKLLSELDKNNMDFIRMLQDVVIANRDQSLFIPKHIRDEYLKENSMFYRDLNEFKAIFQANTNVTIPASASDLDIYSLDEKELITIQDVHDRLYEMMKRVSSIFEKHDIKYTLDGGSLIGAMRNNGFIFWDDDIDIAIPTCDGMLERAKQVLREEVGDQFDIQDYISDPYYSPRLSNFRIRDRRSFISEKDSQLYRKYTSRGLFIDVYAYSPILCNKCIDSIFRMVFIHPLHILLRNYENRYPIVCAKNPKREKLYLARFVRIKEVYIFLTEWYEKHATNDEYYAYMPNYIENICHPGPYIAREDLYGNQKRHKFEGLHLPIPSNADSVLTAFYKDWKSSPYKTIDELKKEDERQWFSKNVFKVSVMKHIDHATLLNPKS